MPDRRRDERLAEGLASALKHFMEGGHPDAGTVERAFRAGWTARDHWGTANLFAQFALAASAEGASGKRWTICGEEVSVNVGDGRTHFIGDDCIGSHLPEWAATPSRSEPPPPNKKKAPTFR